MRTVVFISDRAMLPGLHAALASLLLHLKDDGHEYAVIVFADKLTARDKIRLLETCSQRPSVKLTLRDFSPSPPSGANTLHGNATVYGRVYLADLLPEEKECVYLDADIVVERHIGDLFDQIPVERTLAVDGGGTRRFALDVELYSTAGLDLEGECFNSGVLGMNLRRWRETGVNDKLESSLSRWPGMFRSADQALLNVTLHDEFAPVGREFNWSLTPQDRPINEACGPGKIYHFVGSPKPWDPGGRWLHPNYDLWRRYFEKSSIRFDPMLRYHKLNRMVRTARSLWKQLHHRWRAPNREQAQPCS